MKFYKENPHEDLEEIKKALDEIDLNISLDAIKLIQSHILMDCMTVKARMRVWRE